MSSSIKFISISFCLWLAACGAEDQSASSSQSSTADAPATSQSEISAPTTPELGSFGVDLSSRDLTIKPGDDFFRYANGRWLDTFELPSARSWYMSF